MFIFHIFSNGMGGFYGFFEPIPSSGELAAGGAGLALMAEALAVLAAWFIWAMGGVLYLPLACIVLALLVSGLLTRLVGEPSAGAYLAVLPLLMYGFACITFGVFGATERVGSGAMGIIGWLFFAVAMLVLCGFMCAETEAEWTFSIAFIAGIIIWWASLYATDGISYGAREYDVLVWEFRILGIIAVAGIGLCVAQAAHQHGGDGGGAGDYALALVAGLVPLEAGNLLAGFGAGVCIATVLAAYIFVATLLPAASKKRLSPGSLSLAFIVLFLCYLTAHADLSLLPPISGPNAVALAMVENPVVGLANGIMSSVAGAFAELATMALSPIGDSIAADLGLTFAVPEVAGCLIGFGLVMLVLAGASALMEQVVPHM